MPTDIASSANLSIPQHAGLGDRSTTRWCFTTTISECIVKRRVRLGALLFTMAILTDCLGIVELGGRSRLYGRISDDHAADGSGASEMPSVLRFNI